jgi:serine/threonine-protein kinase
VATRAGVPIALGSGGTGSEEGRAFFLNRLTLFGCCVFLISGGFLLVGVVLDAVVHTPFNSGMVFHLAGVVVAGAIWGIGRYPRLQVGAARAVDAIGTLLLCASFSMMAGGFAVSRDALATDPMHALFIGLLACSYVLLSRAIALPSTPSRTVWISAVSMIPMVATTVYVFRHPSVTGPTPEGGVVDVALWAVAAVAMAAIASRVIFGLRAEVSKIRHLGQYTLEEKIGEGGMGVVYRARHALLRRPTAIKLLAPERAGTDNIHRFEREVQLTAGLSHPSTVAVFDYGRTAEGVFYYAMEFLDGTNLEQLVRTDGPQPPARVVHILQQVAGALAEAHDVGLVHRDVKPANIILCERGGMPDVAKVVDFGLVKRFEVNADEATVAVTAAHTLMGTPLYMAPEAITGDSQVDARSDLYALGAVGYFLLTGTPVFQAKTIVEVCAHHLHTDPEPPSLRGGQVLPPALEHVILQCLAKAPHDRPRDARSLLRALEACSHDSPWSPDEAERWWAVFRHSKALAQRAATEEQGHHTSVIDLANRVNPWR